MKKLASISFLMIFLLSNTELHEVLKVSFLLKHYKFHQEKEVTPSFLSFIYEHYISLNAHTHSNNDHDNLPLKTKDCTKFNSTIVLHDAIHCIFNNTDLSYLKKTILFEEILHSNLSQSSIWEPPQLV